MRKVMLLIGIMATSMIYSCGNSGKENQSAAETVVEENEENEGAQSDEVTGHAWTASLLVHLKKTDKE